MKTAEEKTRIINTTLVVENKGSVKCAAVKIQELMKQFAREALKSASENATYILDANNEVHIVKSSITSEENILCVLPVRSSGNYESK